MCWWSEGNAIQLACQISVVQRALSDIFFFPFAIFSLETVSLLLGTINIYPKTFNAFERHCQVELF